jgi:hypothetical protein
VFGRLVGRHCLVGKPVRVSTWFCECMYPPGASCFDFPTCPKSASNVGLNYATRVRNDLHSRIEAMGASYHLDLEQSFVAVIQQVAGLPPVYPYDTQKQLPAQPQCHWRRILVDKHLNAVVETGLNAVLLGEFALHVGGEPDAGQRPRLGEQSV